MTPGVGRPLATVRGSAVGDREAEQRCGGNDAIMKNERTELDRHAGRQPGKQVVVTTVERF